MSGFRIEKLHAFVAIDPKDGDEGIVSILRGSQWIPAIAADQKRLMDLLPEVKWIASEVPGTVIKLMEFTSFEVICHDIRTLK